MNISLKTKIVLFSILFLIGIVLLIFFPYGSIFLFGTEVLYSGAQVILDKINKSTDLLASITEYLSANTEKRIEFKDVLKEFNLSPSVVKKIFREHMGCGVMDYFTRLKIDRAKELIREENYTFTEIAERLGFNNSQYFTTVFKRVSGMTPTEYAKVVVRY